MRLFVDMDGTLAVFKKVDTLETLYEEGYFLNLKPHVNVVDAIKDIIKKKKDVEVYILSAVLSDSAYAQDEKNKWLDKYLPEVDAAHRIFPPCGKDKKDYVPAGVQETDHLLDDYTKNLLTWEPPAVGIKLLTDINNTHRTWTGHKVNHESGMYEISQMIMETMEQTELNQRHPKSKSR